MTTADPRLVAVAGARRRRRPAAESGVQCTVGGEFAAILGGLGLVIVPSHWTISVLKHIETPMVTAGDPQIFGDLHKWS